MAPCDVEVAPCDVEVAPRDVEVAPCDVEVARLADRLEVFEMTAAVSS